MADVLRPQWFPVLVGVVVGLVWTAAKVSIPLLVRAAIDNGIVTDDSARAAQWAIVIAIVGVVQGAFTGLRRWWAFRVARWSETTLRDRLFAHLQRLHFAYHDQAQTGNLMSRANTDLKQIQQFLVMIPLTLSNAVTVARRHGHPAHDRPGAHPAGARQPAVAQRARQAVRRRASTRP